jgi:hypothetical protein
MTDTAQAPATAPATEAQPAAASAAPSQPAPWFESFQNADLKAWVQAAGVKDPESAAAKAHSLERMLGADRAGRTVVLPAKEDDPAWSEVYTKLGRPESPDGYKLPIPEGGDPSFSKVAASWFHDAGIPARQAQSLAAKWNEYQTKVATEQQAAEQAKLKVEHEALQADWGTGPSFDKQIALAKRAAQQLGVDEEAIGALEKTLGYSKVMKLFAKIGEQGAEDETVGVGGNDALTLTPEAARAQKARLMADASWAKRYLEGDAMARADMERINRALAR